MRRVYDTGTDGGGFRTELLVDSEGRMVDWGRTYGSIRNYKPETYRQVSRATPEQVAKLRVEVEKLMALPEGDERGQWRLVLQADGEERRFTSTEKTFSGEAASLGAAVESISPWRPFPARKRGR